MSFERKYQVFVSSTYEDLKHEREKAQQALLEAGCIPIGMEIFPPSNEAQWEYMKRAISGCDYYILIIAGIYGSVNSATGLSYTEQEYRHATEVAKIPVITFFRRNPEKLPHDMVEADPKSKKKLETFRTLALAQLAKDYGDANELYARVMQGIYELKKKHPEGGWVPARYLPPSDIQMELEALRSENKSLERDLNEAKSGKMSLQSIDTKPNHTATCESMVSFIREMLRTSDSVTIRAMAVSLHFSWDFFKNELPTIISDTSAHKKIILELEMVRPEHLGDLGLEEWKTRGVHIQKDIAEFVQDDEHGGRLVKEGRLELYLYQYRNIPHWHGTLINNHYLFLGRTRWLIQSDKNIYKLKVGQETYRLYASNDAFGGPDRIAMFNSWFDYYKSSGEKILSVYPTE